jgi:hypothetical protein
LTTRRLGGRRGFARSSGGAARDGVRPPPADGHQIRSPSSYRAGTMIVRTTNVSDRMPTPPGSRVERALRAASSSRRHVPRDDPALVTQPAGGARARSMPARVPRAASSAPAHQEDRVSTPSATRR